jgi:putative FmdB family regulatory protein
VPIYEFSCLGCRHTFDVFGSYASREEKQVCPRCEGTNTKALFSVFAVGNTSETSTSSGGGCGCAGGSCACAN